MSTKNLAKKALESGAQTAEFTDEYGNKRIAVSPEWVASQKTERMNAEELHIISLATKLGYISPIQFRKFK